MLHLEYKDSKERLPIHKNDTLVLGRGHFGITDKKCSRHQVEIKEKDGRIIATPKGMNPSKLIHKGKKETIMEPEKSYTLTIGDTFTLLLDNYQVTLVKEESGNDSDLDHESQEQPPSIDFDSLKPKPKIKEETVAIKKEIEELKKKEVNEKEKSAKEKLEKLTMKGIDIVFSFDTTGSMFSCLEKIKENLKETVLKLLIEIPGIKIGIIAHGDLCDQEESGYTVTYLDLSNNSEEICQFIAEVSKTHGGDAAECYELALLQATKMSWRGDCGGCVVLIGDDVPHPPSYTSKKVYWRDEVQKLVNRKIKIYSVQAGSNVYAAPFYEAVAEMSGGFLLHLTDLKWMSILFVGLCYRQHSMEKFDEYQCKVMCSGEEMDDNLSGLFLEMGHPIVNKMDSNFDGHSTQAWWDLKYDKKKTPFYTWDKDNRKWLHTSGPGSAPALEKAAQRKAKMEEKKRLAVEMLETEDEKEKKKPERKKRKQDPKPKPVKPVKGTARSNGPKK